MKTYNSLVATVAFLPLVYGDRVTLNFEDLDVSNKDSCGSMDFSKSEHRYAGAVIMGATVVNSVGTGACKIPIANVDLSDKLENNVLWGDNGILFDYLTFDAGDYISGNTAFDLAVDYSHLADGELDDDETKISIQLLLMNQGDVVQNQEIEKFPTKDGTGPYSIKWSPDEGRYTAFSIAVNLISTSLAFDSPKVALDNIAWDHFRVDGDGNIDTGDDKTTTTAPDTTTVGNSTTRPPFSHTETSAPATTSAPSRSNTTSSTFVFPSPTRTTEVQSSTSTGLAGTSAPTLFGFVAVLAAGAAFL
ncbi:hypothetical protein HDV62DRAFT_387176 [Trichoderma sp. SZMC 28011]